MKLIAINGSPRKNWNTVQLLERALEGAASMGAETELVHLYKQNFKGCISCFGCKLKGNQTPWRCVQRDALSPVLEKVEAADALVVGSPIYLADVTAGTRAFIERLVFPCVSYDDSDLKLWPKKTPAAFFFTMGVPEQGAHLYEAIFKWNALMLGRLGGEAATLKHMDACQFDDYSKYAAAKFDPAHKQRIKETSFAVDCKKAFEIGAKLVSA